jgi:hypothetical protein
MVLSRIFWPQREEVTGEWKRHHNEMYFIMISTDHKMLFP